MSGQCRDRITLVRVQIFNPAGDRVHLQTIATIDLRSLGEDLTLREAASALGDYGREYIKVASEYLAGD